MLAVGRIRMYAALLLAVSLVATGCSSGGKGQAAEGKKAIEGFQSVRAALAKAQTQVDQNLVSLNQLASGGGDMSKTYATYSKEVDELDKAGKDAAKRAEGMRKNLDAYIQKWQAEVGQMQDPTIKASVTERQNAVKANFDKVRKAGQEARAAYAPFLATLTEIRKALSIDMSSAALPGLKPAFENANKQGATLKQKLAAMDAELEAMLGGMGSAAPKK
jgi:chromosome segregation ATPase